MRWIQTRLLSHMNFTDYPQQQFRAENLLNLGGISITKIPFTCIQKIIYGVALKSWCFFFPFVYTSISSSRRRTAVNSVMARRHFVFECTATDTTGCLRSVWLFNYVRDFEGHNLQWCGEAIPGDDDDTEDASDTAEYEGDNAAGGEAVTIHVNKHRH